MNMETPIFYIVLCGIVLIMVYPIYYISAKILDGMGKSYYSLAYNIVRIVVEVGLILLLKDIFHNGACVLVGIAIGEIVYSSLYIITFKILFKRFKEHKDELVTT
jgi:Na+-driven multidrug efflux pump